MVAFDSGEPQKGQTMKKTLALGRWTLIAFAVVGALAASAVPAAANNGSARTVDSIDGTGAGTFADSITWSADMADWYTFQGTAGTPVTITVSSPAFSSYLWVYPTPSVPSAGSSRPTGAIAEAGGGTSYSRSFTLPTTTCYTWSVDSYLGGSGTYSVTVNGAVLPAASSGCVADADGDGFGDDVDAFPNDELEWLDTDLDGLGDNADTNTGADCRGNGYRRFTDPKFNRSAKHCAAAHVMQNLRNR